MTGRKSIFFMLLKCTLTALFITGIFACNKSSIQPIAIDNSYFPLTTGKYIVYDVDSIIFSNFFDTTDTVHFQLMEQVDSPFLDAANETAYKIIRSRRNLPGDSWKLIDVWSAKLTVNEAQKVEENLRFVKMNFPVLLYKSWKGNGLINTDSPFVYLSDWDYQYTAVDQPLQVDTTIFDSVVTIVQHSDINAIQTVFYQEKYAKHIGLVYKEEQNIEMQPGQYPDGYVLIMKAVEHN